MIDPVLWRRASNSLRLISALACVAVSSLAMASEYHGQVTFNGEPVPGVMVTATRDGKTITTDTDEQGDYSFPDLSDGSWTIKLTMTGFATLDEAVVIAPKTPVARWELKMLPLDTIVAQAKAVTVAPAPVVSAETPNAPTKSETPKAAEAAEMPKPAEGSSNDSSGGFLINGSVNNAATSQFTLAPAFGNNRSGTASLYTGGLALILDNSALDARPYSLTGLETPKPSYNLVTGAAYFGGPLNIPHLMPRGPNFFIGYEWTRNRIASNQTGLVPTLAQRAGDLPTGIVAPVSPQAQELLALYPLPNVSGANGAGNVNYNYQLPVITNAHQDALQTRMDKDVGHRDQVYGEFAYQDRRMDGSNLFGFVDTTDTLGMAANLHWEHRFNQSLYLNSGFEFSRVRTHVEPFFANRVNISGDAGVTGNDQDPTDWGPPTLVFSSGIATLSDQPSSFNRNRTDAISPSLQYFRGRHNVTLGGDFRRLEFNYFSQQNPYGTFTFTGAATNISDFADFLSGVPDTSAIAYGNADKYLRQSVSDAYITDDWRIIPELTINAGIRWEYGAPITELKDRLVNLDVAQDFTAIAPVLASDPVGALTGQHYPSSLLRPDRLGIEPRIGLSWRPIPGSSVVVRAGYGFYDDTSVYQATALNLAQQAPLSKSLSVQNSAACPLTLANGFTPCAAITQDTFAVDPNFRVGYAQTWQLAVQRDLPGALQVTATYLGIKGTRGVQDFLPNTYPLGAANPCPMCPTGFVYQQSNGDSTREAGSLQLRRRLRSGFTATLQYTYSKSIDDDSALGGQGPVATSTTTEILPAATSAPAPTIAQNWLNLRGERGLSSFDQRNLLNANIQYTTGMGIGGGTLLSGWRGRVLKEWTVAAQIVAGSGLPETPMYLAAVNGTGDTGSIRPDRTSAPLYTASSGHFLNAAAYTAPPPGQWGDAGRDSIIGPGQFTFNASLARTLRVGKRYNLDIRVDSTNILNHPIFTSYDTTLNPATSVAEAPALSSPLFGVPIAANAMRSLQTTLRLRF